MMLSEIMNLMQIPAANLTTNFASGTNLLGIFIPIALLGIALGIIVLLLNVSISIEKYRRFKRLFKFLAKTLGYVSYGTLTLVVIGIPCVLGYYGLNYASDNPGSLIETAKWVGIIAGVYIGLGLLGYATKNRIWKRIFKYHKIETENKEYKENMKELPVKNVTEGF